MLAVAHAVPALDAPLSHALEFDGDSLRVIDPIHAQVADAKERVGVFCMRKGLTAWKALLNRTDVLPKCLRRETPPVSRAYYKLLEIMRTCALKRARTAVCLCDAPGGFVQAIADEHPDCTIHAASLRVGIQFHRDARQKCHVIDDVGTGDVREPDVRAAIVRSVGANSAHLVTADGATDNDHDHANIEVNTLPLLVAQVALALRLQADGGTFVMKLFGVGLSASVELLAVLASAYARVELIKPVTSRVANDERYVIATGYVAARDVRLPEVDYTRRVTRVATPPAEWCDAVGRLSHGFASAQLRGIDGLLRPAPPPKRRREPPS